MSAVVSIIVPLPSHPQQPPPLLPINLTRGTKGLTLANRETSLCKSSNILFPQTQSQNKLNITAILRTENDAQRHPQPRSQTSCVTIASISSLRLCAHRLWAGTASACLQTERGDQSFHRTSSSLQTDCFTLITHHLYHHQRAACATAVRMVSHITCCVVDTLICCSNPSSDPTRMSTHSLLSFCFTSQHHLPVFLGSS